MSADTASRNTNEPEVPVAPDDAHNPAIIDAHKTFIITLVSAILFIGAVYILILS
ncbi:MAG: hypothetical protein ACE5GJ_04120 [Gemmatimonadota bacterium]